MNNRTRSYFKVVLSLLLTAAILSGCGGQSAGSGSSAASSSTVQSQVAGGATESAAVEDGPFTKYPEPITVTMVKESIFNDDDYRWGVLGQGESVEENRWIQLFRDELNINVVYDWVADEATYKQKCKLSISAGAMPDFMRLRAIGRDSMLGDAMQLMDAGQIIGINDLWDKYASPQTLQYAMDDGGLRMMAITHNGNMVGVPMPTAGIGNNLYFWLRTDWMEKLGLQPPKTMDEYVEYMRAVVDSGIGENNRTYGMLLDKTYQEHLDGFFWCFGAYPRSWVQDADGSLVYGLNNPAMIDGLKLLRQFYADGWIDPEAFTKDWEKAREVIVAGQCASVIGFHWLSVIGLNDNKTNFPDAEWQVFDLPTATGSPVKGRMELGLRGVFVVNKDSQHPEAIIKMMNLYNDVVFGENPKDGFFTDVGSDGQTYNTWLMGPIDSLFEEADIAPTRAIQPALRGEMDPNTLTGLAKNYWDICQQDWGYMTMFGPQNSPGLVMIKQFENMDTLLQKDYFVGAPTETMVEQWSQLEDLRNSTCIRIITGELDPEQGYYDMIDAWKKLGGDQITKEVNEWYDNVK